MEGAAQKWRLAQIEAPKSFQNDLDVLDRYQAFSAEILRISLLGLTGLGALIFKIFFDAQGSPFRSPHVVDPILTAATAFGFAATMALLHRYISSDSMACQLRWLRLDIRAKELPGDKTLADERDGEKKSWTLRLDLSRWCMLACTLGAATGGVAFVVAIWRVL
jgi:hypothetical protein